MTDEEIIALAVKCCMCHSADSYEFSREELLAFTAVVASAEREACAQLCEQSDRYRGSYFAQKIRARGQP